ncbi:CubicO group peptidase, beta-lactamase class C family [Gracilibacillus ureilyticus]|uniref:CubicO group peptidase, beta-lactamase class C family n=1 Tax=Gracilibacillus ureilyticus TaxID=531814 RepID=A0A1H9UGH0_9BACI|nr:serine hydrolase domain-containing protein [Gracilibacillus ureilyticus]SES08630.1 CubicO group peptidase, beta-lactamase class C family [Gracilibacillus ureilyticus]
MKNFIDKMEKLSEVYTVNGLSLAVVRYNEVTEVKNYGVLEKGTERYVNSHSLFHACSISKFVTALLAVKLTDQGFFDLDEDVNRRLSSWKIPDNKFMKDKKVTLRNLLSHQSGVTDPEGSFMEMKAGDLTPSITDILVGKTGYHRDSVTVKYRPEAEFHYSDAGYCVIQQMLEDVMGRSFNMLIDEYIFQPLSLNNCTYNTRPAERNFAYGYNKEGEMVMGGYPRYPYPAACGLWTTASDLAQLMAELMNALKGRSKIGISEKSAREMISPQFERNWTGLGVFLDHSKKELEITSLGWGSGFQSIMVSFPEKETGFAIMTNTDTGVHQLEGIIGEIYRDFCLAYL